MYSFYLGVCGCRRIAARLERVLFCVRFFIERVMTVLVNLKIKESFFN